MTIDLKSRQRIIEEKRNKLFLDTILTKIQTDKETDSNKEVVGGLYQVVNTLKEGAGLNEKEITRVLSEVQNNTNDNSNKELMISTFNLIVSGSLLKTLNKIQFILLEIARQLPSTEDFNKLREDIKNLTPKEIKKNL